ncbi:MAG: hypothetical protein AAGJ18_22950, partial [Bacteroidota bacterium]
MRELNFLTFFGWMLLSLLANNTLHAQQVTFDNNEMSANESSSNPTITNFTVPTGSNRLLVVVFSAANSFSDPEMPTGTFGTDNLQTAVTSVDGAGRRTTTLFLPLGTGGAVTNDILLTSSTSGIEFFRRLTAFTLQGVDQTNPLGGTASGTLSGTTTNLAISGTPSSSLIIESLILRPTGSGGLTSVTPQSGQTIIGTSPPPDVGFDNFPVVSQLSSTGGDLSLDWAFNPTLT